MTKPNLKIVPGRECDKCYYGGECNTLCQKLWYGRLVIDVHCSRTKSHYIQVPKTTKPKEAVRQRADNGAGFAQGPKEDFKDAQS